MAATKRRPGPDPEKVHIGKFDILATYTYVQSLQEGLSDPEARARGMVAAVMGAQVRSGTRREESGGQGSAKKKSSTLTAEAFDRRVVSKLGAFFEKSFVPALRKLADDGYSYEDVKRLVKIPTTWGAKISGAQFLERVKHNA